MSVSPYEAERKQRRDTSRRQNQRDRLVSEQRWKVEKAISLDRRASELEQKNQDYDRNTNGFRERAAADRTTWWCSVIFMMAVGLYVAGEFFASADVAEWLANQIASLFGVTSAETPEWLRRAAGVGFCTIMLGVTLGVKFVTTWFLRDFRERLSQVEVGDYKTHWQLTICVWLNHVARVVYMAAVAVLYIWLFSFAQARVDFMKTGYAAVETDQKAAELPVQWSTQ